MNAALANSAASDAAAQRRALADDLAGSAIRSVRVSGLVALALFAVLIALAVFVPIASGTLANGQISVDGERKVVQHASGGIVSAILVKEGDVVKATSSCASTRCRRAPRRASSILRSTPCALRKPCAWPKQPA